MRVLLGLAAFAATAVNGQTVTLSGSSIGQSSLPVSSFGQQALASIFVFLNNVGGTTASVSPSNVGVNTNGLVTSNSFQLTVPNAVSTVVFTLLTNTYTAQIQHRWNPNYTPQLQYTCDTCAGGTTSSCNQGLGPGSVGSPSAGFPCASLTRTYTFSNLVTSPSVVTPTYNSISMQLLDRNTNPGPNTSSYSFFIIRFSPPIVGDPQITGMQGQDFQVHGIPDEIFNMITYPNLQVNARFVYLSSGACHDNFTACFAHPGTYIGEEGIRVGKDKVHVVAGSFKKGLTVSVNGVKITDKKTSLKLGSVHVINHRRVVVKTPIMALTISNSDKFLNQETALFDQKLLTLGSERKVLGVGESFHSEVPLHGLQGQTWRNVEYPSGLEYEGSISDYHVISGNLYGSDFEFNQFKQ